MIQYPKLDLESLVDALADRLVARLKPFLPGERARGSSTCESPTARLLTVEQAAAYLGRTKASMQHLISAGRLPIVRADRRVFFDVRDLDSWIERNKEAAFL